ncbi:glycosyltransferase 61 family protein [Alteromonas sp. S015]|uniref:glycosyltransferase 61 family protein n=1 Tax=Alteromonas sp. S015 TaxID=3117401 RepID=UPI002FE236B1
MEIVQRAKSLTPKIEIYERAVVVPIQSLRNKEFQAGVVTRHGDFCELSVHMKPGLTCKPPSNDYSVNKKVAGKHLFCGMLQNSHFGHFMVESITRIWASTILADVDSLVFYKREKRRGIPTFVEDFISLFSGKIPISIVEEPTEFETLFVPNQLGIERSGVFIHHAAVESNVTNLLETIRSSVKGKLYPEKVYVSRSQLSGREGTFVGEKIIEQNLKRQGYYVIYPEKMSVFEQLQYYVSAKKIIFADGSAYHLFAIVVEETQDVFVIWRRKKHSDFDFQLLSKTNKRSKGEPYLKGYWKAAGLPVVSSTQISELDCSRLKMALIKNGFVDGSTKWDTPEKSLVSKEVEAISAFRKVELEYIEVEQTV